MSRWALSGPTADLLCSVSKGTAGGAPPPRGPLLTMRGALGLKLGSARDGAKETRELRGIKMNSKILIY